jgi:hypothetical protein
MYILSQTTIWGVTSGVVNPILSAAKQSGAKVYAVTGYADTDMIDTFRAKAGTDYPFYVADDILLKTIVRSNPGIVLWKDGTILKKWHYRQVPGFEEIQQKYMK